MAPSLGDDNVKLTEQSVHPYKHSGDNSIQAVSINTEVREMAAATREVGTENEEMKTIKQAPYDPNLVCPMCKKRHRVGEIQKYRKHVDTCEGDVDADDHM